MKVIISGASGKMGKVVASLIEADKNAETVCGIDLYSDNTTLFPVYQCFKQADDGDVIIDFSNPSVLPALLKYAVDTHTPAVIATTGLSPAEIKSIEKASKHVPIFFTANMSLGVNLLTALCKKAASVLGDNFDIEIVESHHNQKIDAPSGTALMLANAINNTLDNSLDYVYDRHSKREKRTKNEIGIHAVRGGNIVGKHEVIFAGTDEIIELTHTATSKAVFANGAIAAAKFILNKENGLYSMNDMI